MMEITTISARQLAEDNIRLVPYFAHKYAANNPQMLDEYISAGYLGLWQSAQKYNPSRGVKFSTLAGIAISRKIFDVMRKEKKRIPTVSLDATIRIGIDQKETPFHEIIPCPDPDPDDIVEKYDAMEQLYCALQKLPKRDRYILCTRYGVGTVKRKQFVVAKELGIAQSYISRLEKSALLKLRKKMVSQ